MGSNPSEPTIGIGLQPESTLENTVVHDRPTLGSMPGTRLDGSLLIRPGADLFCSGLATVFAAVLDKTSVLPAFPLTSLLVLAVCAILGDYGSDPKRTPIEGKVGARELAVRMLVAALLAWSAGLISGLSVGSQLGLFAVFLLLDAAARLAAGPLLRRLRRHERWVLVGDESTAERLRGFAPLRDFAQLVGAVEPDQGDAESTVDIAALDVVERYHADRIVISSQYADDRRLIDLMRRFKAVGVPVSLLPRPLDLLDAPAATPSRLGGVPLIDVEALAARDSVPYAGPDRRSTRSTKVSVVVPAMNEGKNIGRVLRELPADLHEVILVDGNSRDDTVEAARAACPDIRVMVQSGRGKGDAFRTGFAAVTGNLIVMLDADGSAMPSEIPRFVEALEAGADFAKGSRFMEGGGSDDITFMRRTGNAVLSGTANLLHGTNFTDLCYGYNAFWTRCLPFISLDVPGFEVETLINLRIASAGMRITEVPSYEKDRLSGESNLKTFRDGFRVMGTILGEARRNSGMRGHAGEREETSLTASLTAE
ncbi:MAG TPA: glycosyltransferase family 2 protein [Solirubrobacterales bacterium]|nr:glycosyltransferase family 2 protein [Solirubrobacterales bacterium]